MATVQTDTSTSCPPPAAATDVAAATEVPVDEARYETDHVDGHTAEGDGDRTTKPMVHSPSRGNDGHTTDTTASSVNFRTPHRGTHDRWSSVTAPHVTPGGRDTSTYHSHSNGPT